VKISTLRQFRATATTVSRERFSTTQAIIIMTALRPASVSAEPSSLSSALSERLDPESIRSIEESHFRIPSNNSYPYLIQKQKNGCKKEGYCRRSSVLKSYLGGKSVRVCTPCIFLLARASCVFVGCWLSVASLLLLSAFCLLCCGCGGFGTFYFLLGLLGRVVGALPLFPPVKPFLA